MYWEVHPGEATVMDIRRLVKEAMDCMPRRIRVAVTIEEKAHVPKRYGRSSHAWATMQVAKYGRDARNRQVPKSWRMRITRRSLFLPRKELLDLIKHEIGHGLLHGAVTHGREFERFCKQQGMPLWMPPMACHLANLRWRAWKHGHYVHDPDWYRRRHEALIDGADQKMLIVNPKLRDAQSHICKAISSIGGRALVVGGSVRDALIGMPAKDLDIEVYGVSPDRLLELLRKTFRVDLVGQSFGVIKICGLPIDVSIPRQESKVGSGHRGFHIQSDPAMSVAEGAARRDFTMNAMAFDPLTSELIDNYEGQADLDAGILRHTSDRFSEDPLRVLRGMQFAARFELTVAPETIALCRTIAPEGLPKERLFEEWKKLVVSGVRPSMGLAFLKDSGWIRYFPELKALIGCEQDPKWHPEGDAWVHTLHAMDAFAIERTGDEWEDLIVGLAVLCHDFGKPTTSELFQGRIRSPKHESAGEEPTLAFLGRLTDEGALVQAILPLVLNHMRPRVLFKAKAGNSTIRRLARRVRRIDRLIRVARADHKGCPLRSDYDFPAGDWLMKCANDLSIADSAPHPIIMGRHLLSLGLEPGPHFGEILRDCYEAQLDGTFGTLQDGLIYVQRRCPKTA